VEHVDELIYGQSVHALSSDDEERVALHVAECDRCRRQLREAEAVAAGVFQGGGTIKLELTKPAKPGDVIAITIEPAGGTKQPTTTPIANGTV
jgi:hypothetical protein